MIVDHRNKAQAPFDPKKFALDKHGRIVVRDPKTIDAVVIHQTACRIGPAADDKRRKARVLQWPYHAVTYSDGDTVLAHAPTLYTYHANSLNRRSLGFAVEGEFPARIGDELARHSAYTELQADGARRGLKRLVEDAREAGCPIRFLFAHRQSSANRTGDPGQHWFRLLSRFARDELGLEVDSSRTVGDGLAVPLEWL